MEAFLHSLQAQFPFLVEYKYVFFFLASAFEGLNLMVLAGFLVSINQLRFLPTIIVLIGGYVVNGYMWYSVGYFGGSKPIDFWLRHKPKYRRAFERVREYFEEHTGRAIIFTKMTLTFTIVSLLLAGSLKYNPKKFSLYNFIGSVGWAFVTFSAGYFFGEGYQFLFDYWRNVSLFILIVLAAIAFVYALKIIF
ncbi:MAG TPA: DedA family protein, partial [Candidatus Paceibacterota bacterium]|nr:DedA family protein [Candidatus Paceibacterota bacterium]